MQHGKGGTVFCNDLRGHDTTVRPDGMFDATGTLLNPTPHRDGFPVTPSTTETMTMPRKRQTFGAWLASLRDATGKTRQQMADAIGCTSQSVSNWERDANIPSNEYMAPLARALGIRKSELALAAGKA
jgi:DNA-binding XRE family transcriptional regulator